MMSPSAALHDPVFRAYLVIVPVALIGGGAILAFVEFGLKRRLGSIWATYRSWIVMSALGLVFVFAGRIAVVTGVTLLSLLAFRELVRVSALDRDWWLTGTIYGGIIVVAVASLIHDPHVIQPVGGWYGLFATVPFIVIAVVLILPVLRDRARGQIEKIALGIIGFLYTGWMFGHLGFLANATHAYGLVCYVIFATEINDISAFTIGKLLGRHPLRKHISPGKTIEGAVGALLVSMILPWVLRFSFPFFGVLQLVLIGLIVGIGSLFGDLSVSMIKRDIGIKDMGSAIPGHGGILDRIDSLIFVAPLFMHMARYYHAFE